MSDLISRSALIDYIKMWDVGCGIGHNQKTFIEAIARQPIAYDVDAVVEEIKKLERPHSAEEWFADVKLKKAIKIVRKGGV